MNKCGDCGCLWDEKRATCPFCGSRKVNCDELPEVEVYRRADIPRGTTYYMPAGSRAQHLTTGEVTELPPGYYAHPDDPRSDDEIREAFAEMHI